MTDATPNQEINLRYRQVEGRMLIEVESVGFDNDPNMVALYLSFTLDQLLAEAEVGPADQGFPQTDENAR